MSTHLFGLVDTAFTYSHSIGRNEFNGTGFRNPVDMAIDDEGKVYVLNRSYENRPDGVHATIATMDEQFVGEFSKFGEAPGDMYWPTACALDAAGNLYVADEWLNRITIYDADGEYLRHWGEKGSGPGQFNAPSGITISGDTLCWWTARTIASRATGWTGLLRASSARGAATTASSTCPGASAWTGWASSMWPTGATTAFSSSRRTANGRRLSG